MSTKRRGGGYTPTKRTPAPARVPTHRAGITRCCPTPHHVHDDGVGRWEPDRSGTTAPEATVTDPDTAVLYGPRGEVISVISEAVEFGFQPPSRL